ncbi:unnamed protein product, partial [marine sediment metagenome]
MGNPAQDAQWATWSGYVPPMRRNWNGLRIEEPLEWHQRRLNRQPYPFG